MSKNFQTILEQIRHLSRREQLALIASIAQLIGEDEPDHFPDYVIEENRRRLATFDAGETKGIPYRDAMNYVREQINARRG
jgi:hypothetical protein